MSSTHSIDEIGDFMRRERCLPDAQVVDFYHTMLSVAPQSKALTRTQLTKCVLNLLQKIKPAEAKVLATTLARQWLFLVQTKSSTFESAIHPPQAELATPKSSAMAARRSNLKIETNG